MSSYRFLLLLLPFTVAVPSSTYPKHDDFGSNTIESLWPDSQAPSHSFRKSIYDTFFSVWPSRRHKCKENSGHATPHQAPAKARYADQLVLRFNVSSTEDLAAISEASDTLFLDIWDTSDTWLDVRLRYDDVSSLLGLLPSSLRTSHTPLLTGSELARAVQQTYPSSSSSPFESSTRQRTTSYTNRITRRPNSDVFFDDYRSLPVIIPWMRLLQSLFSTHVRIISVGTSYEGRDIPALRIGVHPTTTPSSGRRKIILVTGGSHAREWVSTSTINYIAYNLITSYGRRKPITQLLETFDFIFVPTINPDGYDYTWSTDRLWRKTRQPTPLRFCHGLDLDRTWSFKWDGGSSTNGENPCSEGYAGTTPLEAKESQALAAWARNETEHNNVEFVGLLDLHSYSQQILYPFSYSCTEAPPNLEDLEEIAQGLAKAIRQEHHENYRVLSACGASVASSSNENSASGGSLLDWFYHEMGVRHAYQIKLRDKGSYGFLLPREEIVPTGQEVVKAVEYFGRVLGAKYVGAAFEALWVEEEERQMMDRIPDMQQSGTQKVLEDL